MRRTIWARYRRPTIERLPPALVRRGRAWHRCVVALTDGMHLPPTNGCLTDPFCDGAVSNLPRLAHIRSPFHGPNAQKVGHPECGIGRTSSGKNHRRSADGRDERRVICRDLRAALPESISLLAREAGPAARRRGIGGGGFCQGPGRARARQRAAPYEKLAGR